MTETAKCIYCLKEKPKSDFNTEHVISRMLGRYSNAPTLSNYEVCQDCNSYFCNEIENKLSLDSLEGLLRLRFHRAKEKDTGRHIGRSRITITGKSGIVNGLKLTPSVNGSNPEGTQLTAEPSIGIKIPSIQSEFVYYSIETLPQSSELIEKGEPPKGVQIIYFGYERDEVEKALLEKGYGLTQSNHTENLQFSDITQDKEVYVDIRAKIDPLLHRLALKNILNYACYTLGKEFILRPSLTNLRNYARYGTDGGAILCDIREKGILGIQENMPRSHVIGIGITALHDGFYVMGFVSWFNAITYSFILEKVDVSSLNTDDLKCIVCDNEKRQIVVLPNYVVIDWPGSGCHIQIVGDNLLIVPAN